MGLALDIFSDWTVTFYWSPTTITFSNFRKTRPVCNSFQELWIMKSGSLCQHTFVFLHCAAIIRVDIWDWWQRLLTDTQTGLCVDSTGFKGFEQTLSEILLNKTGEKTFIFPLFACFAFLTKIDVTMLIKMIEHCV